MSFVAILLALLEACKTILPVILAVLSGLLMILTKTLGWGISETFQALAFVFGGASVVGLKGVMAELSTLAQAIHVRVAGTGTGTSPAAGTGTGQEAKAN